MRPMISSSGQDGKLERHWSPVLAQRLVQQAAVARLGELALDASDPGALIAHTIELVTSTLDADLIGIAELQPGGREFALHGGPRFPDGLAPDLVLSAEWNDSQAGFTLVTGQPTVVDDYMEHEDRFRPSEMLIGQGVRSGVTVLIGGRDSSYGVLGAFSHEASRFSEDDIGFLQSVANVFAHAVDRWRVEEQARREALRDPLTGLPNRMLGLDRIAHALARDDRDALGDVALMVVDVDRFNVINDSLGHRIGDTLLRDLALRLRTAVRPGDTVARFGGDEFVILCDVVGGDDAALEIARRVGAAFAEPFVVAGDEHVVTASIGVVMRSGSHSAAEELLRDADAAMYRAKERGRDRVELFDPGMRARAVVRQQIEGELRRGIERDELRPHFQPIVSIADGRVTGFEALVRWEHPDRGVLMPAQFVPVAEESGLIVELGRHVLRRACQTAVGWRGLRDDLVDVPIHVNISPRQIADETMADELRVVIDETGIDPRTLTLEITETTLIERARGHRAVLENLVGLGVELVLDDFGTGYSSLSYLQRFPISGLKVDRSFVMGLCTDRGDAAIVDAIMRMARALGLRVIAEGVERPDQLEALRHLGCEYAQGWLFARSLDVGDAREALVAGRADALLG
jgi:diguanylate cyclase (GGDEF)-like protein